MTERGRDRNEAPAADKGQHSFVCLFSDPLETGTALFVPKDFQKPLCRYPLVQFETSKTGGTLSPMASQYARGQTGGNFALSGSQVAIAASTVFSSLDCITRLPFWLLSLADYRPRILTGGCLALFSQIAASRRLVAPNPPGGSRRVSGGAAENKGKLGSCRPGYRPCKSPKRLIAGLAGDVADCFSTGFPKDLTAWGWGWPRIRSCRPPLGIGLPATLNVADWGWPRIFRYKSLSLYIVRPAFRMFQQRSAC